MANGTSSSEATSMTSRENEWSRWGSRRRRIAAGDADAGRRKWVPDIWRGLDPKRGLVPGGSDEAEASAVSMKCAGDGLVGLESESVKQRSEPRWPITRPTHVQRHRWQSYSAQTTRAEPQPPLASHVHISSQYQIDAKGAGRSTETNTKRGPG